MTCGALWILPSLPLHGHICPPIPIILIFPCSQHVQKLLCLRIMLQLHLPTHELVTPIVDDPITMIRHTQGVQRTTLPQLKTLVFGIPNMESHASGARHTQHHQHEEHAKHHTQEATRQQQTCAHVIHVDTVRHHKISHDMT